MSVRGGHTFPPECRLRRRNEFDRVRGKGRKQHTPHFVVIAMLKTCGPTRLGLTVSRKVGGAVCRNRVKRLLREFFRRHRQHLPRHTDLSIIAKRGATDLDYAGVCDELNILTDVFFESRTSCSGNPSSAS